MAVQKPLQLVSGVVTEVTAVETSAGSGDEGKIVALNASGKIDSSMLSATGNTSYTASEALSAGALINIWNNSGNVAIRNADNTSVAKRAHGFVQSAVGSGNVGVATIGEGNITGLTSLTAGGQYFLGTVGAITLTAPTASASIVQGVGVADSTTSLQFIPGGIVLRA